MEQGLCPSLVTPPPPKLPDGGTDATHGHANHDYSAALCQVYDSIYMDIPMHKVKFNVNGEYAYVQNFKVLQSEWPPRGRLAVC